MNVQGFLLLYEIIKMDNSIETQSTEVAKGWLVWGRGRRSHFHETVSF